MKSAPLFGRGAGRAAAFGCQIQYRCVCEVNDRASLTDSLFGPNGFPPFARSPQYEPAPQRPYRDRPFDHARGANGPTRSRDLSRTVRRSHNSYLRSDLFRFRWTDESSKPFVTSTLPLLGRVRNPIFGRFLRWPKSTAGTTVERANAPELPVKPECPDVEPGLARGQRPQGAMLRIGPNAWFCHRMRQSL